MAKTKSKTKKSAGKLKISMLGGIGEIGKNLTVFEYENDIIIVDCGLGFPDEDMPGIDIVIPDMSYLESNAEKIRGVFITHGHEDHIGALPYLLKNINVPVFATKLTLGILDTKLCEHNLKDEVHKFICKAGESVTVGNFNVEFIAVNHSIADSVAFAIKCPAGTYVITGDFKVDLTPIQGEIINLTRFGELGNEGVTALLCESTNAERPGYTPSERKVGESLDAIFRDCKKRVVIATFSSNVHRVQQIIDASAKYGRKVAVLGRSMVNIVTAARRLDYMKIPDGMLIDVSQINKYAPEQITLITTGSQGEHMSALYRMAYSENEKVSLTGNDIVVISAHPIPGNEKTVGKIISELLKKGVNVVYDQVAEVHVSGHACQEEIKLLTALIKPKYFIPIHGEYKHLVKNAELASLMNIPEENILITEIGQVLESDGEKIVKNGKIPSGKILIDGFGVGDVGSVVLRDRKLLALDGIITVVAVVDLINGEVISEPEIVSRGFVYMKESEELTEEMKFTVFDTLQACLDKGICDSGSLKSSAKSALTKFIYSRTKRKPMILTFVVEI